MTPLQHRCAAAFAVAMLSASCGRPAADLTVVRPTPLRDAPRSDAPSARTLGIGERLRARPALLGRSGWLLVKEGDEELWVDASALAPYPIAPRPGFVIATTTYARAEPMADGALVEGTAQLRYGSVVSLAALPGAASDGFTPVVAAGVVVGFLPSAEIREGALTYDVAMATAVEHLRARRLEDARAAARGAMALDPSGGAARALLSALEDPQADHVAPPPRAPLPRLADAWPAPQARAGSEAWIWAFAERLRGGPAAAAPGVGSLRLGAHVQVLVIAGRSARVAVDDVWDDRRVADLGRLRPAPPPAESEGGAAQASIPSRGRIEGWLDIDALSAEARGPEQVAGEAQARIRAGALPEAAALALGAYALAPTRGDLAEVLLDAAIRAGRYDVAADVARTTDGRVGAVPHPLDVELTLFYGCRGDPLRAAEILLYAEQPIVRASSPPRPLAPSSFAGLDGLPLLHLPDHACLVGAEPLAETPTDTPSCQEGAEFPDDEPDPGTAAAIRADAEASAQEDARRAAWLAALQRTFPRQPRLRVRVRNLSPAPMSLPTSILAHGYRFERVESPRTLIVERFGPLHLPSPLVPPHGTVDYWLEVGGFEASVYGVGGPDDLAAATARIEPFMRSNSVGFGQDGLPPSAGPWQVSMEAGARFLCPY